MRIEEDDGYMIIEFPGGEVTIDVWLAADRFSRAAREAGNDTTVYDAKLREALAEYKIPPLSYRVNCKIANAIWEQYEELRKKDEATQPPVADGGSPNTTESIHSS